MGPLNPQRIYTESIDSLKCSSDKDNNKVWDIIKTEITDAYAKGKISELDYNLLNDKLSKSYQSIIGNNQNTSEHYSSDNGR